MYKLLYWLKQLIAVFFPFRCHACKASCDFGIVLCDSCRKKLAECIKKPERVSDTTCDFPVYAMSSYDSFAADCVKIIKYRPSKKLAVILAESCAETAKLKDFLQPDDVLIPVPMHAKRLDQRGFNQASVIAETYAEKTGCKFCPAVIRSRFTRPQADCTEEERMCNLENAFALAPDLKQELLRGKRLIVIDDVATTGTTLTKCVAPLRSLPAKEIIALVVSHSYKKRKIHNSQFTIDCF